MKDILVIADPVGKGKAEEQIAFFKALNLATLSNAGIHVVVFCYESMSLSSAGGLEDDRFSLKASLVEDRELWWVDFIKDNQKSVSVSYEVIWEKYPHSWVVEHCRQRVYDLIVKTGHRSETPFYTPTDWQLFRKAPAPVYCVTATGYQAQKTVLVALDLMTASDEKQLLNRRLLETAFQLSVQTASQLHCCFAIRIPTLVRDMELIDVAAHTHKVENEARSKNEAWLDDYDIDKSFIHIEQGTPWRVVSSISAKIKAHCIVIGSAGRTGVAGQLIGNTAEKVIHNAKTDLLVINPTKIDN
jgi:universal stress protein E